jgi:hypothetical protein
VNQSVNYYLNKSALIFKFPMLLHHNRWRGHVNTNYYFEDFTLFNVTLCKRENLSFAIPTTNI